ncbi:MAG TPA: hypothetical protein ENK99_02110 [Campylobacterales bacterium]|nr:hypothetical protein [Campylobacterales bacterium]
MITQQLLDYIKQQLEQRVGKEQIKSILLNNGWQENDIEEGVRKVEENQTNLSTSQNNQIENNPTSNFPSDNNQNHPNQKLFWISGIVVLTILVIISGIFYFSSSKKTEQESKKVAQNQFNQNQNIQKSIQKTNNQKSNQEIENQDQVNQTETKVYSTKKIEKNSLQQIECGTINSDHFMVSPPLNNNDKKATNCFNQAILKCRPAIIKSITKKPINSEGLVYILGMNNNNCTVKFNWIKEPSDPHEPQGGYYSICEFPMNYIKTIYQEALKENKTDYLFFAISIDFVKSLNVKPQSDGWYYPNVKNIKTGKTVGIRCK